MGILRHPNVVGVMACAFVSATIGVAVPALAHAQSWRAGPDGANTAMLTGAVAATVFASWLDQPLAHQARKPHDPACAFERITRFGDAIGGAGPLLLAGTLTASGYAANDRRIATLGKQSAGAIAVSTVATTLTKGIIGRARPYAAIENSHVYKLGRGFFKHDLTSFPSGHSSGAFAIATVLATGVTGTSLATRRVIGGAAYAAAASVALSRVSLDQHWSSDVVAGAAIGIASGLWATRNVHHDELRAAIPGVRPAARARTVAVVRLQF